MTLGLALYLAAVFAAGLAVVVAVEAGVRWLFARIRRDLSPFQQSAADTGARDRAREDEHARWLGADQS